MKKNKKYQKIKSYFAVFDPALEGGFNVSFPDFPGCVTFGRTLKQAKEKAVEILELWLEELADSKVRIPRKTSRPVVHKVLVKLPVNA